MIDVYGCTSRSEQYTGWRQLPPPILTAPPMTIEEAARFISELVGERFESIIQNRDSFRQAYRSAAARLHPDANGQNQRPEWKGLQDAKTILDRHHQEAG